MQYLDIHRKIEHLESPERAKHFDLEKIFSLLPLKPDHVVADIGCGTGFFTLPLAMRLPQGKVFALDILEEMLEGVRQKVAQRRIINVETKLSGELYFPLEAGTIDGVFLGNVLHETTDREAFLRKVGQLVRPGGWVAVLEWKRKLSASGPSRRKRLSPATVQKLATLAGLISSQIASVGENHYILLLAKPRL